MTAHLENFSLHVQARRAKRPPPPSTPADMLDIRFLEGLVAKPKLDKNDLILLRVKGGFDTKTTPEASLGDHIFAAKMEVRTLTEIATRMGLDDEGRKAAGILSAADMAYMEFLLDRLLVRLMGDVIEE